MLQPAADRAPLSDAALELALLLAEARPRRRASQLLNVIFRASEQRSGVADCAPRVPPPHSGDAREREQPVPCRLSGRLQPRARHRVGYAVPRKVQPARSGQVVPAGTGGRSRMGARRMPGSARTLADDDPPAAAAAAARALEIDPHLADARAAARRSSIWTTRAGMPRASASPRCSTINPSHLDARALPAAITYVRGDRARVRCRGQAGAGDQPGVRRDLPRRGRARRRATTGSTRRSRWRGKRWRSIPTNARAHAELGMHLMRTGDEAEARQVARPGVPDRSVRQGHAATCWRCSTSSTSSSRSARGTSSSSSTRTKRRSCASTRCRWRRKR